MNLVKQKRMNLICIGKVEFDLVRQIGNHRVAGIMRTSVRLRFDEGANASHRRIYFSHAKSPVDVLLSHTDQHWISLSLSLCERARVWGGSHLSLGCGWLFFCIQTLIVLYFSLFLFPFRIFMDITIFFKIFNLKKIYTKKKNVHIKPNLHNIYKISLDLLFSFFFVFLFLTVKLMRWVMEP